MADGRSGNLLAEAKAAAKGHAGGSLRAVRGGSRRSAAWGEKAPGGAVWRSLPGLEAKA